MMMELAQVQSFRTAAIIAAVLALVIGVVTVWLNRRRRDVWSRLAREHGLTYEEMDVGLRLRGKVEGCAVTIETGRDSSDTGEMGVEVVTFSTPLPEAPPDMAAEGEPGQVGSLAISLSEERVTLGDEDFDHNVLLQGADADRLRHYWTPARRHAFLQLVNGDLSDRVAINDGQLLLEQRTALDDRNQMNAQLLQLTRTAREMTAQAGTA